MSENLTEGHYHYRNANRERYPPEQDADWSYNVQAVLLPTKRYSVSKYNKRF